MAMRAEGSRGGDSVLWRTVAEDSRGRRTMRDAVSGGRQSQWDAVEEKRQGRPAWAWRQVGSLGWQVLTVVCRRSGRLRAAGRTAGMGHAARALSADDAIYPAGTPAWGGEGGGKRAGGAGSRRRRRRRLPAPRACLPGAALPPTAARLRGSHTPQTARGPRTGAAGRPPPLTPPPPRPQAAAAVAVRIPVHPHDTSRVAASRRRRPAPAFLAGEPRPAAAAGTIRHCGPRRRQRRHSRPPRRNGGREFCVVFSSSCVRRRGERTRDALRGGRDGPCLGHCREWSGPGRVGVGQWRRRTPSR